MFQYLPNIFTPKPLFINLVLYMESKLSGKLYFPYCGEGKILVGLEYTRPKSFMLNVLREIFFSLFFPFFSFYKGEKIF